MQVKQFMEAARQSMADSPSVPTRDIRVLRARLLFEEILEFVEASGLEIEVQSGYGQTFRLNKDTVYSCVDSGSVNVVEIADSLADIGYVSYGAALAYGIDMEPIENAVHENNMTKFDGAWFDEHGKLRKGPNYKPIDLEPLINEQL